MSTPGIDGTPAETAGPAKASRPLAGALAAAVLVVSAGLTLSAARQKSLTFDEICHLTGGYSYWKFHDYRLHTDNGNLVQRLETLALLPGGFTFPSLTEEAWRHSKMWHLGQQFFFELGNDADAMLARGRAPVILFAAGLGALVYAWSRRLFGPRGGLVSVTLCAFCPTMLAHGGLATSDMAAGLFFMAAVWSGWEAWHRLTPGTLLLSGLALGGLFLSKMSAVCVLPAALLLLAIRTAGGRPLDVAWPGGRFLVRRRLPQLAILLTAAVAQAAMVVLLIWAAFGFRYAAFASAGPDDRFLVADVWSEPGRLADCVRFARDHRLLPEGYLEGFAYVQITTKERASFLNGEFSMKGWPQFFPYAVLVKTPLPLFGLLALAVAGAGRWRAPGGPRLWDLLYDTAPLTVFGAVYWAFALTVGLNIGHRHMLPTYPVMYILAGAAATWIRPAAPRLPRFLTLALLAVFVAESVAIWPNYLAYFNVLAGGPANGYRHLVDSSLDWGQDLKGLKQWLMRNGLDGASGKPVYLSYFGSAEPEYYDIRAYRLPGCMDLKPRPFGPLTGGVYCISATMLQAVNVSHAAGPWTAEYETRYQLSRQLLGKIVATNNDPAARQEMLRTAGIPDLAAFLVIFEELRFGRLCAFLRGRVPDDEIGYTILIYRLSDADVERALSSPVPTRPVTRPK